MSKEELQEELTLIRRQLRDAMKLLQTAESGLIGNANVVWEQRREELGPRTEKMKTALERIRDCDWVISLPDRMDAVRDIAREALE